MVSLPQGQLYCFIVKLNDEIYIEYTLTFFTSILAFNHRVTVYQWKRSANFENTSKKLLQMKFFPLYNETLNLPETVVCVKQNSIRVRRLRKISIFILYTDYKEVLIQTFSRSSSRCVQGMLVISSQQTYCALVTFEALK